MSFSRSILASIWRLLETLCCSYRGRVLLAEKVSKNRGCCRSEWCFLLLVFVLEGVVRCCWLVWFLVIRYRISRIFKLTEIIVYRIHVGVKPGWLMHCLNSSGCSEWININGFFKSPYLRRKIVYKADLGSVGVRAIKTEWAMLVPDLHFDVHCSSMLSLLETQQTPRKTHAAVRFPPTY